MAGDPVLHFVHRAHAPRPDEARHLELPEQGLADAIFGASHHPTVRRCRSAINKTPRACYLARVPENERSFSKARRRADRGGDKRERILKAAIRVFARKGFYATRVSEIAKAAGVADGTIYLYFKNKDAVLVSIFEDRIGRLVEVLREEVQKAETVEAKIRRVIELQLGLLEGQRDLAEVITVNLRQSSRLLKQYAAPMFREYLDVIATVFRDGQRTGEVRRELSPRVMARALWGALDGIALTWALADGDPANLRKAAHQYADIFLHGVLVD
jgi:TetR/AcrR family fatty acid metabolism transcriptional regulator